MRKSEPVITSKDSQELTARFRSRIYVLFILVLAQLHFVPSLDEVLDKIENDWPDKGAAHLVASLAHVIFRNRTNLHRATAYGLSEAD